MDLETVLHCEICGAEIVGAPVFRNGVRYCCEVCASGEECECDLPPEDDRRGVPGASIGEET